MGNFDIGSAVASDLTNAISDYSVDTASTDGISEQKETTYDVKNWEANLGYYKNIPELRGVIDAKCRWTIGKGFTADELTTLLLDTLTGWGKDTFSTIIENMMRCMLIAGDAFAEIIRDD
jgi:hypothetical protein